MRSVVVEESGVGCVVRERRRERGSERGRDDEG